MKRGLHRKMRQSFLYNQIDGFSDFVQRCSSTESKTPFPHTNLVILIFRFCEIEKPSLYVARRPVTGCGLELYEFYYRPRDMTKCLFFSKIKGKPQKARKFLYQMCEYHLSTLRMSAVIDLCMQTFFDFVEISSFSMSCNSGTRRNITKRRSIPKSAYFRV